MKPQLPHKSFFPRIRLRFKLVILSIFTSIIPLLGVLSLNSLYPQGGVDVTQFTIIVLTVSAVLSIIVALLFANRVVGPIETLYKASKQFGVGNFDLRVQAKTNDEIEDLANQFNLMADTLKQNIQELTIQNKLLSAFKRLDDIVLATPEISTLSQSITDLIKTELGGFGGAIALIDNQAQILKQVAISKNSDNVWVQTMGQLPIRFEDQLIPLTLKDNLLVKAIDDRKSFYAANLYDIQRGIFEPSISEKLQRDLGIKGIFIYPLITQNRIIGVVFYLSTIEREQIPPWENSIREKFTGEIARILDNALLYHNLRGDKEVISAERNKMELVLSGVSDSIIVVDLFRNIVIFNEAAEILTGIKKAEAIGQPIDQIFKIYEGESEITPLNYCPIKTGPDGGETLNKKILKVVSKDNKTSFVNLIAGQIREGSQANIGCILTLHDITKEKSLEQMKLDFVSMAAHELRTPLTSIRGYLSVFMQENDKAFSPDQFAFLKRISIATQQLMALVENLLSVTKIERGAFNVALTSVDWLSMTKQTVTEFTDRARDKKLELKFIEPTGTIPPVQADKLRIGEVLSNLVSNAINYTQSGSIEVSLEHKGDEVITHVKDTGAGIPPDAVPKLFTKFYRVQGPLEQGTKGTGLGLYIAKSIIDMHKGKIWVESTLGKGTTFSFSLQAYKKSALDVAKPAVPPTAGQLGSTPSAIV